MGSQRDRGGRIVDMIELIVTLIILLAVIAVFHYVVQYLGLPDPIGKIAMIVVVVMALVYLLRLFPGLP